MGTLSFIRREERKEKHNTRERWVDRERASVMRVPANRPRYSRLAACYPHVTLVRFRFLHCVLVCGFRAKERQRLAAVVEFLKEPLEKRPCRCQVPGLRTWFLV